MQMTALWKQLAVCGVLIVAASAAWQSRDSLLAIWSPMPTEAVPATSRQGSGMGTPVIVAQTTLVQDDRRFSAIGTGFALRSVTLRAPSGGEIAHLPLSTGIRVLKDETLLHLESDDAERALALAQARLDRATSEYERLQSLENSGLAASSRYEQAKADFLISQIERDQAADDLANRTLNAPFDGYPGFALVEVGDRIAADDPVASFDDRSAILVEFDLPEALLSRVALGLPVQASTPSMGGRSFEGKIIGIDSRVSADTRTARVRASIDNSEDLLRPGASFALELDLPGAQFPAVPELALQFAEGSLFVWYVSEDMAQKVPVRLVRRSDGLVIVDGPLQEGDLIVVEGTQRLREKADVQVLNTMAEPRS